MIILKGSEVMIEIEKRVNDININCLLKDEKTLEFIDIITLNQKKDLKNLYFEIFAYSFCEEKEYDLEIVLMRKKKEESEIRGQKIGDYIFKKIVGFSKKGSINLSKREEKRAGIGFSKGFSGILKLKYTGYLEEGEYELTVFLNDDGDKKVLSVAPFGAIIENIKSENYAYAL